MNYIIRWLILNLNNSSQWCKYFAILCKFWGFGGMRGIWGEYDLDVGKKWVSEIAIRHTRRPVLTLGTVKRSSSCSSVFRGSDTNGS